MSGRFPKDEDRRKMWVEAIQRDNFVPSNYSLVCNVHFTAEDYQKRPDLVKLTNKAVPSVCIGGPENVKRVNNPKTYGRMSPLSRHPQKAIKKTYDNLWDHTYVLKYPDPSTSKDIVDEKPVHLSTFKAQTAEKKESRTGKTQCSSPRSTKQTVNITKGSNYTIFYVFF